MEMATTSERTRVEALLPEYEAIRSPTLRARWVFKQRPPQIMVKCLDCGEEGMVVIPWAEARQALDEGCFDAAIRKTICAQCGPWGEEPE